jgi:hypothetical protein
MRPPIGLKTKARVESGTQFSYPRLLALRLLHPRSKVRTGGNCSAAATHAATERRRLTAGPSSFASGLWSRFVVEAGRYALQPHVDGPRVDDAVILTSEPTIAALTDSKLQASEALARRLMVVDGPIEQATIVASAMTTETTSQPSPPRKATFFATR